MLLEIHKTHLHIKNSQMISLSNVDLFLLFYIGNHCSVLLCFGLVWFDWLTSSNWSCKTNFDTALSLYVPLHLIRTETTISQGDSQCLIISIIFEDPSVWFCPCGCLEHRTPFGKGPHLGLWLALVVKESPEWKQGQCSAVERTDGLWLYWRWRKDKGGKRWTDKSESWLWRLLLKTVQSRSKCGSLRRDEMGLCPKRSQETLWRR